MMCIEYYHGPCIACGESFMVFVEFCGHYQTPMCQCPGGTVVAYIVMKDGGCNSLICPNGANGGCAVM